MHRAFITGISGQDGIFLSKKLLQKGYQVYGFCRKNFLPEELSSQIQLFIGDIGNEEQLSQAIQQSKPHEIYHLASQSSPAQSWNQAAETLRVNGLATVHLFEAIRQFSPHARVFHASTSDLFGQSNASFQNEKTPFNPCNPYSASKLYAHQMAQMYRGSHHLYIANGILFNHESELRPLKFVTQKIAYGAACAHLNIHNSPDHNPDQTPIVSNGKLTLGNLNTIRDWGYAPDFVEAMWLMLQQEQPEDFVIGTGRPHSLKELCELAYQHVGLDWNEHVISGQQFIRPQETTYLVADPTKANEVLNWHPSTDFHTMIRTMVDAQIKRLQSPSG